MIKRIKTRNFLSLKEVDVELGTRNVFVGPNMSGKSNLIECLKFLQDATGSGSRNDSTPLQEALSRRGGFTELVWKGHPHGLINFALIAELGEATDNKPDFILLRVLASTP
jgi:predicted ATPase